MITQKILSQYGKVCNRDTEGKMESNKILIGIEFGYDQDKPIGGFELMVLRDLKLNQLLEGIRIGLMKKTQSQNASIRTKYEEYLSIFDIYFVNYDSVIITSSNQGIDQGISVSECGEKMLFEIGFITSTRLIINKNGHAKVYSLNNPDGIVTAFRNEFPKYNISPRQLTVHDIEPIKIIPASEPPAKPKLNVLAMILPSMAMTIAMVIGRTLFMSNGNGVSAGGMIGLSVTMVVVNILVSLFNFRRQIKEHNEKVDEWKEHYESYIHKTIQKIADRQKTDADMLNEEYPDIQTLFDETMKVSDRIYSRVQNDKDFMTVRLGSSAEVETLFPIEGEKGNVIFSPTKYKWNAKDDGIEIVLFPEKPNTKKGKENKDRYDKTEKYLIDLPYDIAQKYRFMSTCSNVPLLLPLEHCGTLGIVSGKTYLINRIVNNIVFELCFYHSPEDLQFIMLYDGNDDIDILSPDNTNYHKFKFSSHFRELFNQKSQFVFDKENAKGMFDSLLNIIYLRSDAKDTHFTQIVVIIYEEYGIKEHAIANFLPKAPVEGEPYRNELGITFIFCKAYKEYLPTYCSNIIDINNKGELFITPRSDRKHKKGFVNTVVKLSDDPVRSIEGNIDLLRKGDFYNRIKILSAIYYTRIAQNAKVPSYVTIFKLLNINKDNFRSCLHENWTKEGRNNIEKTLSVPVGESENSIVYLDLHEKYDGPHMLVAGTTGSGKSETIISYLIGLCYYYTPEEINLLLIDMKGGGFIKRIGKLPHVVGTVTDVDGDENGTGAEYMLKRFLDSLIAEVKRRKIMFNQLDVDSIDGYIKKYKLIRAMDDPKRQEELQKLNLTTMPLPLSHLIFVVDEFTELKRASAEGSDMDFIAEITTIARVGRSLGFHIILVSQNIEGAITDDIRVNSKARLCLKVATKQASKEMLGNDKAAAPDMPGNGRAYLLVGTGSRFDYFQSAYSGAESSQSLDMPIKLIEAEKTGSHTTFYDSGKDKVNQEENAETQLTFMVNTIIDYYNTSGVAVSKPHIIFNQPLPKKIVYVQNKVLSLSEKDNRWQDIRLHG
jgi:S-DNA-T family DNA segregation ATPase FtsK/SpoIIIE